MIDVGSQVFHEDEFYCEMLSSDSDSSSHTAAIIL